MSFREDLTSEQRSIDLELTIDPGFVHHRKIETILGREGINIIHNAISKIPDSVPEWQRTVHIDHIYKDAFLMFCSGLGVKTLQDLMADEKGRLFCSVENLEPCNNIYETERAISKWKPFNDYKRKVEFHYSTKRVVGDTLKSRLFSGEGKFAIVAELFSANDTLLKFDPIIMGFPWLRQKEEKPSFDIMWYGTTFYENFIEDFDEFAKVKEVEAPLSPLEMKDVSEKAFKICLSQILGDSIQKDWGGETSDYFSSHIHLNGKRKTAAFLLKGPSHFAPMTLNHLGKNNDQILRLSREPAQILFVQHSHDISSVVKETLRAFAIQPSNPRRYCFIDGRDSLRLLRAYNLFDKALELSKKGV
jgi:hypothetical protein